MRAVCSSGGLRALGSYLRRQRGIQRSGEVCVAFRCVARPDAAFRRPQRKRCQKQSCTDTMHSITYRATPSPQAVTRSPFASQVTSQTQAGCGSVAAQAPVCESHTFALLSSLPVAMQLPSGDAQTEYTRAVWPMYSTSGVAASHPTHKRAVPSWLAVAQLPGSASTHRTQRTASPWSCCARRVRVHAPLDERSKKRTAHSGLPVLAANPPVGSGDTDSTGAPHDRT